MDYGLTHITLPASGWLRRVRIVGLWFDIWSERRDLASLDRRMLADIGITDTQARTESQRPPWDLPPSRW